MARELGADVVLGLGGGSSMDSAKAIAVEATHEGSSWDYLFFKKEPTEKTLPIVSVSTTSGTGSHVTQVAVITETATRTKSAIYNSIVYPKVSIVDPELMLTVPEHVTASTGWDVFCHSFESCIHVNTNPYVQLMGTEAIRLVIKNLPVVLNDLSNLDARSEMALADTYAGLCIANAGVTLPHGMGMAIGGMYPHIAHGETLAIVYPAFSQFTWQSAVKEFAALGRAFNPSFGTISDEVAAEKSCDEIEAFLKKIGMRMTLSDKGMPEDEIPALAEAILVLPDYQNNPRVATPDEVLEIVKQSF
jgi:alcohol dehydrogenase class IV